MPENIIAITDRIALEPRDYGYVIRLVPAGGGSPAPIGSAVRFQPEPDDRAVYIITIRTNRGFVLVERLWESNFRDYLRVNAGYFE